MSSQSSKNHLDTSEIEVNTEINCSDVGDMSAESATEAVHTSARSSSQSASLEVPIVRGFNIIGPKIQVVGAQRGIFKEALKWGPMPHQEYHLEKVLTHGLLANIGTMAESELATAADAILNLGADAGRIAKDDAARNIKNAEHELGVSRALVCHYETATTALPQIVIETALLNGYMLCSPSEVLSYVHHNALGLGNETIVFCAHPKIAPRKDNAAHFHLHIVQVVVRKCPKIIRVETMPKRFLSRVPIGATLLFTT